jgi:hypothetical protein
MNCAAMKLCGLVSGVLLLTGAVNSIGYCAESHFEHNGRVEILDDRYHHGHYYVPRGVVVRELPAGYHPYLFHGSRFYFSGGVWYAPGPQGFVVVRPPVGLLVTTLPPFYTTVWIAGTPYYYANDVYYRWASEMNGYEVVDPPAGADQAAEAAPQMAADDFFLYPKNGQTAEQQSADRYECHSWARTQTGFDPTQAGGGVPPMDSTAKREQYRRAMTACLEARGYSVK